MACSPLRVPALIVIAVASFGAAADPLPPPTASSRNVRATLVSEMGAVQPGRPLWLGLRLQMQPGWHVYWKQPGDAGLPPRAQWTLPAGFAAGEMAFPCPERFTAAGLASYGYSGDVLLLVPVTVPASAVAGGTVEFAPRVSWLECREVCIPAKASLGLALPVAAAAGPSRDAPLFRETRARLPVPAQGWRFDATPTHLVLRPPAAWKPPADGAEFFSAQDNVIRYGAAQAVRNGPGGWGLELVREPNGAVPAALTGVLVARRGARVEAIEIEAQPRKETRR